MRRSPLTAAPFLAVVGVLATSWTGVSDIEPGSPLLRRDLASVADHVALLVVEAYGGEGYVFWSRR